MSASRERRRSGSVAATSAASAARLVCVQHSKVLDQQHSVGAGVQRRQTPQALDAVVRRGVSPACDGRRLLPEEPAVRQLEQAREQRVRAQLAADGAHADGVQRSKSPGDFDELAVAKLCCSPRALRRHHVAYCLKDAACKSTHAASSGGNLGGSAAAVFVLLCNRVEHRHSSAKGACARGRMQAAQHHAAAAAAESRKGMVW